MWYPGAVKKEIPPGVNDPTITPIGVILHTDAGDSASLYNYFNGPSGGIESHFHIPKSKPVEQYRDTGYEADANLQANSFYVDGKRFGFISVETQGLEGDPWNDYQIAEIKKLILWARSKHPNIMLRVCPSPTAAGIGYHTMFGAPGPWTPVAKSCPGPLRIKQFNNVLVPWFKTATPPEDDMPTIAEVEAAVKRVIEAHDRGLYDVAVNGTEGVWNKQLQDKLDRLTATLDALDSKELGRYQRDEVLAARTIAAISAAAVDPSALAQAIVDKLPAGSVDQATVEAGVRAVLREGTE